MRSKLEEAVRIRYRRAQRHFDQDQELQDNKSQRPPSPFLRKKERGEAEQDNRRETKD